ncbi:MAG: dihydrofolate reductase, partial [Blastocatellia bacterium]
VITRQPAFQAEGCLVAHSLDEAISLAQTRGEQEAFVIGGAEIYTQALPQADRLYLTLVDAEPEADAFFPAFDTAAWEQRESTAVEANEKDQFDSTFLLLQRPLAKP